MINVNSLSQLGYVYNVHSGFQFDLNTVLKKTPKHFTEGHWCDHNCIMEYGNYACPAAFSCNRNVEVKTIMSFENIVDSLKNAKSGLQNANKKYLNHHLSSHCKKFNIPKEIEKELQRVLSKGDVELNMFGGNPELHPDFLKIIVAAKNMGWRVCTTTTGKKFMYDEKFLEQFLKNPPHLLAISADDYENIKELKEILHMDLKTIKNHWQKANPLYGQRKKAYESIYTAKLFQTKTGFPKILFNMVLHPGNLDYMKTMLELFSKTFPDIILNPYPAQSSFSYGADIWQDKHLDKLEKFIDTMIVKQVEEKDIQVKRYQPRMPYWLTLKSIFLTFKDKKNQKAYLSGKQTWQCYRNSLSGKYLQASCSDKSSTERFKAGGHPGCFWNNKTVTDSKQQLWKMKGNKISNYLLNEKSELAMKAKTTCPGCIMPRLMFDGITVEAGLDSKLQEHYQKLRYKYFKF